jgi:hypothetical protein
MIVLAVLFIGLWITGIATSHTMGGFIHVLLVLGIVVSINGMIRGNRTTKLHELGASTPEPPQR